MDNKNSFIIKPIQNRTLLYELKEIFVYRELLFSLAMRDIQIRYKQASIGIAWVVLQPIITTAIFTFVFSYLAKIPSNGIPYPVFVLSGLLMWQYFSRVLTEGSLSLVANSGIITKIYFPRALIPLIVTIVAAVDFFLSFLILSILMLLFGVAFQWTIVFVPFILLCAGLLAYSISLLLSPLNAIYRDIGIVLPFLVQIAMYLTPVIYPLSIIPDRWRFIFEFNPAATIIESMRWTMLGQEMPSLFSFGFLLFTIGLFFTLGIKVFRKLEPTLVDRI